ncbi:MAG: trimeric intracellular cation channel family protein [Limisphaerales bacterium]
MSEALREYMQQGQIRFPIGFDLVAIVLFSMSGVIAAMRRGYDFIGVFILALVTGAGGGLIRDGIFLQNGPPALTQNWQFLPVIVFACFLGWVVNHWIVRFHRVIAVLDAVGLSAYTMVGLLKGLHAEMSVPSAIMVSVVNAAGGGLLRDVITQEEPLLFKPGQFYVVASLLGCAVFLSLEYRTLVKPKVAEWISMSVIFGFRLLAILFNWRTGPVQPLGALTTRTDQPPTPPTAV